MAQPETTSFLGFGSEVGEGAESAQGPPDQGAGTEQGRGEQGNEGSEGTESQKAVGGGPEEGVAGSEGSGEEGTQTEGEGDQPTLYEIGGKQYTEDQVRDALRDRARIQETEAELEARRKRVEHLEYLEPRLRERQDLVRQLFEPEKARNFDAELTELANEMPDGQDREAYAQWMLKRDKLLFERQSHIEKENARVARMEAEADAHNNRLESDARKKYVESGKLSETQFRNMVVWIAEHARIVNKKAPEGAFDTAYRELHRDKYEEEIALNAVKKMTGQLKEGSAIAGKDSGLTSRRVAPKTEMERENDEFVARVKDRAGAGYVKL